MFSFSVVGYFRRALWLTIGGLVAVHLVGATLLLVGVFSYTIVRGLGAGLSAIW